MTMFWMQPGFLHCPSSQTWKGHSPGRKLLLHNLKNIHVTFHYCEFSFAFMIPPIGRKGFSLNFLTSFSEGASWCFFPVSLFTASSLFNCKVMKRSKGKALALEVPVSTQIHPLQCSLCFWRAFYPAVFCTLPLFLQPWQLPSSVKGCL